MAQNMINYYNYVRKNDKVLTHTLVNPTYNHQQGYKGKFSEKVALQVVKATDAGVIVNYPDWLIFLCSEKRNPQLFLF